jgi:predicted ABC-type ATPase
MDFTFETVMSHPSKVEFFERAAVIGYVTILFFICTQSVALNIQRVAQRVDAGGHDVPEDKIVSRYHRSLALLPRALQAASRAYVYDNSDRSGAILGLSKSTVEGKPYYQIQPDAPQWIKTAYKAVLDRHRV